MSLSRTHIIISTPSYAGIAINDFLIWLENERKIPVHQAIKEEERIELITEFFYVNNVIPSLENITTLHDNVFKGKSLYRVVKSHINLDKSIIPNSVFDDDRNIKYSSIILYPNYQKEQKKAFFSKYFKDLHSLSSSHLNIYYSKSDTYRKSGFETLNLLGKSQGTYIKLPAVLIWQTNKGILSSNAFSVGDMNNRELFNFFENLIQQIRENRFDIECFLKNEKSAKNALLNHQIRVLKEIKGKIGKRNTKYILDQLQTAIEKDHPSAVNKLIPIKNSYKRLKEGSMKGTITFQDFIAQENKIMENIMYLIDTIIFE